MDLFLLDNGSKDLTEMRIGHVAVVDLETPYDLVTQHFDVQFVEHIDIVL